MMKKKILSKNSTIFLIAGIFFCLLTLLRFAWLDLTNVPEGISAKQGTVDLRAVDTSYDFKTKLQGEWALYPDTLLVSEKSSVQDEKKVYSNQPESWNKYFKELSNGQYGSYRLTILKQHNAPQMYGMTIPEGLAPYELYVNGQLIGGLGNLKSDNERTAPISRPITYYFTLDSNESEIIIQGVQTNRYSQGGFTKEVIFGDLHSMEKSKFFSIATQIAVCLVFLFYLLFVVLLVGIGVRSKSLIYFAMMIIFTCITVLVSSNKIIYMYLPFNWVWANKLFYFSYIINMLFFVLFLRELVKEYSKPPKILNVVTMLCIAYLVFIILSPIEYIFKTKIIFTTIFIVSPIIITVFILYIVIKGQKGIVFLLLTGTAVAGNSLFFSLRQNSTLPYSHYPFDLLIAITALSAYWFTRYFQSTLQTEELSVKLQKEIDTKDDFLANTSHELRNPLHGMMSIAQTLLAKQNSDLPEKNNDDIKLLLTIGNHMTYMLDDLLDLVQLKEKTLRLHPKAINVHNLASGVSNIFLFMLKGRPIELIIKIPKDLPPVLADETRLIQIFTNLIHNAIKFTEKGTITIDAELIGKKVYISVTDTGIGIEKDIQERIFKPYEQADSSMTSIGGGLGLGLSICHELVALHGGKISLASTVGKGSTFTFSLPITNEQADNNTKINIDNDASLSKYVSLLNSLSKFEDEIAAVTEKETLVTSHSRILIVDDDAVNLQVLANALSTEAYDIETALSGSEALEMLQNNSFDLVISDIMMPHMSGYELAKKIREQFSISELPILFLTARQQRVDIQLAFLSGANDYVKKPMEYVELKSRVHALVRVKQSSEERLRIEAAWLQAQIQPHFFFNTLSSIISLHGVDNEQMEKLLLAFSDYLQMSFDFQNVDLTVPIDYELKLVRSYLAIEQIRFGDRILVTWDIPMNMELSVPPLSIQTLVENAIQHGILPKRGGGNVTIRITETEHYFTIAISDDGVGFDNTTPQKKTSVGLVNTQQRLKQLFNAELTIKSVVGQGTTISFPIPKK
ncbi:hybrid sensor histidine kinase/response regulator [Lysinibacillus pakistanensis]|uniref:hybrid sensor histidine kinase/response regulator n=1 Tax=Lysinibacillus pakistanensis TaxID=759811 RepID=UPI003D27F1AA